ncbi:Asp-tRNA(Asn)/Glu-tRNA(Gln) amidotransferase subunit GatC [Lyticum sinuosum]|uniref:Glutamyl-tRNA(Gln) amidotransferase subunit C n=1 Tax=Lyticum sinuosum TaxID=1332059 RepID=A0AAE5AHM0_9RICK|nr:Asp-tRNA(Asn)/Glu-tRNA(Gln) amidotransferase subunit GatC [Lyticum sinuosum]MDZ5761313.1 Glutamyl-tRNA(Gln) amidotransferase subunit C [Lyticum sinuosum]
MENSELSSQYIKKLSQLALIIIDDEDSKKYASQFKEIFKILNMLQKIDTKDVIPMSSPNKSSIIIDNILDNTSNIEIDHSLIDKISKKSILANAPKEHNGYFVVPKIIE